MSRFFALYKLMKGAGINYGSSSSNAVKNSKIFFTLKKIFSNKIVSYAFDIILAIFVGFCFYTYGAENLFQNQDKFKTLIANMVYMKSYFILVFSLAYIGYIFYINSDIEKYIVMPFKPWEFMASRLVALNSYAIIFIFIINLPVFIFYMYYNGISIVGVLSMIVSTSLNATGLICLVSTIMFILMHFFKFLRSKAAIQYITTILVIVLALNQQNSYSDPKLAIKLFEGYNPIHIIYPDILIYRSMMNNNIIDLIVYLVIGIVFIALYMFVGKYMYLRSVNSLSESAGRRKKINIEKTGMNSSLFRALLGREFKVIFRNPMLLMNTYIVVIILPVMMIYPIVKGFMSYGSYDYNSFLNIISKKDMYLNVAILMLNSMLPYGFKFVHIAIAVGMFLGMSQQFLSPTAFSISIEGANGINIIKTWPINSFKLFHAKVVHGFIVNIIKFLIFVLIIAYILLPAFITEFILFFVAFLVSSYLSSWFSLGVNILFPTFDWQNELMVVKRSKSVNISVILYMALLIVAFMYPVHKILPLSIVCIVMPLVLGVITFVACMIKSNEILNNFNK